MNSEGVRQQNIAVTFCSPFLRHYTLSSLSAVLWMADATHRYVRLICLWARLLPSGLKNEKGRW